MTRSGRIGAAHAAAGELLVEARVQRVRRRQLLLSIAAAVTAFVDYERRHGREPERLAERLDAQLAAEKTKGT